MSDTVLQWNDILLDAIRADMTAPPLASRAMAMVQTAVYDALNAASGSPYEAYHVAPVPGGMDVSLDAAAASAAYTVLSSLFPKQQEMLDARYQESLEAIGAGAQKDAGMLWGQQVAEACLEARAGDGWNATVEYTPAGEGYWEPTPPAFASAALPQWGDVTPWTMTSDDQFRPGEPPALTSEEFAEAFNEVKAYGGKVSEVRTADQTEIAKFWVDGPGTATPPGHWQNIAQQLGEMEGNGMLENARMLAMVSVVAADAGIAAWDCKFAYDNIRPVTAIRNAGADGNPLTEADPTWESLIPTPPFPDYISGHSTFSGASAKMLSLFFGQDDFSFTTSSDGLPGVFRSFESLWDAAEEAGISRIYGGIHWQFSNQEGLNCGAHIAENAFEYFFRTQTFGSDENDRYTVEEAASGEVVHALEGDDRIHGASHADDLHGNEGSDRLWGMGGNDMLAGDEGGDRLWGGAGDDELFGGLGKDTLYGQAGDDWLEGNEGSDTLSGGAGNDVLWGGEGRDTLQGGAGADIFVYRGGEGKDVIQDFNIAQDVVALETGLNGLQLDSFDDLEAYAKGGASVHFDFGDGDSLQLSGIAWEELSEANFYFA